MWNSNIVLVYLANEKAFSHFLILASVVVVTNPQLQCKTPIK